MNWFGRKRFGTNSGNMAQINTYSENPDNSIIWKGSKKIGVTLETKCIELKADQVAKRNVFFVEKPVFLSISHDFIEPPSYY